MVDCSQEGKAVKFEFMYRRFESFQSSRKKRKKKGKKAKLINIKKEYLEIRGDKEVERKEEGKVGGK